MVSLAIKIWGIVLENILELDDEKMNTDLIYFAAASDKLRWLSCLFLKKTGVKFLSSYSSV